MADILTTRASRYQGALIPSRNPQAALVVEVYGVIVRISGITGWVRSQVAALLRPFKLHDTLVDVRADITLRLDFRPVEQSWHVSINDAFLTEISDTKRLAPFIEWLVISRAIERSNAFVAFHAASVARRRQAAILVAASGSGKSTLTVGLLQRGWKPLADDLTTVDARTRSLHPFRRCFHTDEFTRAVAGAANPLLTPVAALHDYTRPARWAPAGCAPRWIVLVRRDGAAPSSMTPITRAATAAALYTSTIRNALDRSTIARLSVEIASTVEGCWELNNGDLDSTLDLLDRTLRPA